MSRRATLSVDYIYAYYVFRLTGWWRQSLPRRNGLANSRFHTLLFGINRLRWDKLPHCWETSHCSGAFVQPEFQRFIHVDVRPSRMLTMERLVDFRPSDAPPGSGQTSQYKR